MNVEPTREHWEPDYARLHCSKEGCGENLQFLGRHHCRKCGKLFCGKCMNGKFQRRLNMRAEYASRGVFCKVCYGCFTEDNGWFSAHDSPAWLEATNGHSRDLLESFSRFRTEQQNEARVQECLQRDMPLTTQWRVEKTRLLAAELKEVRPRGINIEKTSKKSQEHWVPDRGVAACQNRTCQRAFTMNERKHHCRVCGRVFCDSCSPKRLDLAPFSSSPRAERSRALLLGDEEQALERACEDCFSDLDAFLLRQRTRKSVEGAASHVLRNLYLPIPGYVTSISNALSKFDVTIGYLERMCELANKEDKDGLLPLAAADVLDLRTELMGLFKKYEERFAKLLGWEGWKYVQLVGEGRPVVNRNGTVREDLFVWKDRVCVHQLEEDGTCTVKADTQYDTVSPGQILFEGFAVANVEEQLRVLNNLRQHHAAFWNERYHANFKRQMERAQSALIRASNIQHAPSPQPSPKPSVASPDSGTTDHDGGLEREGGEEGGRGEEGRGAGRMATEGHLLVHVFEAAELSSSAMPASKLNPQVLVRCAGRSEGTAVKRRTDHPVWNESFSMPVAAIAKDVLEIEIISATSSAKGLGTWTFGVAELVEEMEGSSRGWVPLTPPSWSAADVASGGRIRLSVKYIPEGGLQTNLQEAIIGKAWELPSVTLLVDEDEDKTTLAQEADSSVTVSDLSLEVASETVAKGASVEMPGERAAENGQEQREDGESADARDGETRNGVGANGLSVESPGADDGEGCDGGVWAGTAPESPQERGKVIEGGRRIIEGGRKSRGSPPDEERGEGRVNNSLDVVKALTEQYVETYAAFNEVKGWKTQDDAMAVLGKKGQAVLEKALSMGLEAVGSALQGSVQLAGMEWKSYRGEVVARCSGRQQQDAADKGEGLLLLPMSERVQLQQRGDSRRRLACAVGVLERAVTKLKGLERDMLEVGCGPGVYPHAHTLVAQARGLLKDLARTLAGY